MFRPPLTRPSRSARRARRRAGFTLLELMTIVTIVLILAAVVAPAASRSLAIFRAQSFASDVLMMARAARQNAMESGRATAVRFTADGIEVRRGNTSLCRATDWATAFTSECDSADDATAPAPNSCAGVVRSEDYDTGYHAVSLTPTADGAYDVCYQPNGEALAAPMGGLVFSRIPPATAVAAVYEVRRLENGESVDPVRRLIVPFDGSPRSGR